MGKNERKELVKIITRDFSKQDCDNVYNTSSENVWKEFNLKHERNTESFLHNLDYEKTEKLLDWAKKRKKMIKKKQKGFACFKSN